MFSTEYYVLISNHSLKKSRGGISLLVEAAVDHLASVFLDHQVP
jgi:hypothetical protein